jgi:hypothetical protein
MYHFFSAFEYPIITRALKSGSGFLVVVLISFSVAAKSQYEQTRSIFGKASAEPEPFAVEDLAGRRLDLPVAAEQPLAFYERQVPANLRGTAGFPASSFLLS